MQITITGERVSANKKINFNLLVVLDRSFPFEWATRTIIPPKIARKMTPSRLQVKQLATEELPNRNRCRASSIGRRVLFLSPRWSGMSLKWRLKDRAICRPKVCFLLLGSDAVLMVVYQKSNSSLNNILAALLMATLIAQGLCCCFSCCCQEISDALKRLLGPEKVTKVFYLFLVVIFTVPTIVILFFLNDIQPFL